jgi:uncharacterized peroxidase-related enzyme
MSRAAKAVKTAPAKAIKKAGSKKASSKTAGATSAPARPAAKSTSISAAPREAPKAEPIIALDLPPAPLDAEIEAYFQKCRDKIGYVPNVLLAYTHDLVKLKAFAAMYNDLMLAPSGLSKLEREMIAVAVSSVNRCYYCLTAHGAAIRQLSGDPELGEMIVMNYRAARLDARQRAMLDFSVKLTEAPWSIEDADRNALRAVGFSERDIWDIGATAAFYNMSNRVATATDMRPNHEYHASFR